MRCSVWVLAWMVRQRMQLVHSSASLDLKTFSPLTMSALRRCVLMTCSWSIFGWKNDCLSHVESTPVSTGRQLTDPARVTSAHPMDTFLILPTRSWETHHLFFFSWVPPCAHSVTIWRSLLLALCTSWWRSVATKVMTAPATTLAFAALMHLTPHDGVLSTIAPCLRRPVSTTFSRSKSLRPCFSMFIKTSFWCVADKRARSAGFFHSTHTSLFICRGRLRIPTRRMQ